MKDKSAVTSAHQIFISAIDGLLQLARLAFNSPLNPNRFAHEHGSEFSQRAGITGTGNLVDQYLNMYDDIIECSL